MSDLSLFLLGLALLFAVLGVWRSDLLKLGLQNLLRASQRPQTPSAGPGHDAPPHGHGLQPHETPPHKPDFHRSGKRH